MEGLVAHSLAYNPQIAFSYGAKAEVVLELRFPLSAPKIEVGQVPSPMCF